MATTLEFDAPESSGRRLEFDTPADPPFMTATSLPEAAANIVTGMGASAVGGLAGAGTFLGGLATGKSAGESLDAANQNLSSIQDRFTYQPRSVVGKGIARIAGLPFEAATGAGQWLGEAAGKPFGLEDEGGLVGNLAAGAGLTLLGGRQALRAAPRIADTAQTWFDAAKQQGSGVRAANLADAQAASIRDAPRIDAAAAAKRLGVALDPAVSNPTFGNRLKSWAAGETELDSALSAKNARKWADAQAQELGVPNLSVDALKAGREKAGAPYREIKALPDVASGAQVTAAIEGILARDGMTPAVADFVRKDVAPLVDKIATMAQDGINGADVVNLTKKLRKDANTTYKNPFPEVGAQALADARMAVSKALEDLTAQRLEALDRQNPGKGYGDLADRWKAAREYIAKSHVAENATNADTGILDPTKIAALTAKDNALTGVAADIGKVANNFSKIANPSIERFPVREHIARYGPMGLVGGLLGSLLGAPGEGAMAGMLTGAIGSAALRKLIASDRYQAKHAFPQDFRPAPVAPLSRIVQINKDIPYSGLPPIVGSNVIPGSWREGLESRVGASPLPVMSEDLLPNNAGGAVMTPQARTGPLPQLPPVDPLGLPVVGPSIRQTMLSDILRPLQDDLGNPLPTAVGRAGTTGLETGLTLPKAPSPRAANGGITKAMDKKAGEAAKARANLLDTAVEPELMSAAVEAGIDIPLLQQLNRRWTKDTGAALKRLLYETKDSHGIVKTKSLKDLMK